MINVTENRRGNLSILDNPDTIARKTHNEDKQTNKLREKKSNTDPHQQPLKETLNYTNKPFAVEKFRVFS
jgi:hypothetical protein